MISHETLLKATVAGSVTVTVLAIPFFVDLDPDEQEQLEPSIAAEEVYEPPTIRPMPDVDTPQHIVVEVQDLQNFARSERIRVGVMSASERSREADRLRALIAEVPEREPTSCRSNSVHKGESTE